MCPTLHLSAKGDFLGFGTFHYLYQDESFPHFSIHKNKVSPPPSTWYNLVSLLTHLGSKP
jgi:hypothetical protein